VTDEQDPVHSTPGERAGEVASIALSAVPYVGGPLAEIASSVVQGRQNRRLNAFLTSLATDLQNLRKRIEATLGESEPFQNFAERIFTAAGQTVQQEKLDALRAVFLNTVLSTPPRYDRGLEMVDLIMRLQPRHLILIRILADPREADRVMRNVVGEGGNIGTSINQILRKLLPEWDEDDIARTWEALRREELVTGAHIKAMITDRGYHQLEGRLTQFGTRLVNYLINPAG
jgi:hypothetical protein